jgi:imidazolonepropionase-like amidohydrolase
MFANLKRLYDMGAKVGVGTDMGGSYLAYFNRYVDELKHFADAGIPIPDTLQMATRVNADILGMGDKLGTLEKGKQADLVAVQGNPLENLDVLKQVYLVIKDGAIIKAEHITT